MKARWIPVAAVAATALIAAGCGGDDNGKLEKQSFTVTERETDDFGFVDAAPRTRVGREGPERLSVGDVLSFRSDLLRGGRDVGDLLASCTALSSGSFSEIESSCEGTYTLDGGTLTAQVGGQIFGDDTLEGAITGGTGRYAGATGTFSSPNTEEEDETRTRFTIWQPEDAEDESEGGDSEN